MSVNTDKPCITSITGARGLRAIMEEILVPVMYDIPDAEDIVEVIITAEYVDNPDGLPPVARGTTRRSA